MAGNHLAFLSENQGKKPGATGAKRIEDTSDLEDGKVETIHIEPRFWRIRKAMPRWRTRVRLIISLAPFIYVWALPMLSRPDIHFAYRCPEYPACYGVEPNMDPNMDSPIGTSVSSYISTTQATGAMAFVMFYPAKEFWVGVENAEFLGFVTLCTFHIFFGLFLMNPAAVLGQEPFEFGIPRRIMHVTTAAGFCGSLMAHAALMIRHGDWRNEQQKFWCTVDLLIVIFAMGMVGLISCADHLGPWYAEVVVKGNLAGVGAHLFYGAEALGLSFMSLFPVVFDFFEP